MSDENGATLSEQKTGTLDGASPASIFTLGRSSAADAIGATINLFAQFGESRVLSSPTIMVLNNQVAMLRAADEKVYFTVEVQTGAVNGITGVSGTPAYTSTIHTVPVGFVMTVTPQISSDDQVTLYVRPTISRIVSYAEDPGPTLAKADFKNLIPQMHTSEMESVLKLYSGEITVMGGLMEESVDNGTTGLPGLSRLPVIRNFFSQRKDVAHKSELVIFIKPTVIKNPSVNGDLKDYQQYLPNKSLEEESSAISTSLSKGKFE